MNQNGTPPLKNSGSATEKGSKRAIEQTDRQIDSEKYMHK